MELLAVPAPLHGLHHQVFGGHEGQVLPESAIHHRLVDPKARCYVLAQPQDGVGAEDSLRRRQIPRHGF